MTKQFTPCPACGAVGEVNSTCQFCGTTILLKEGATPSNARIIKKRTVTPQQYAERISIYEDVYASEESHYLRCVRIGNEEGIINLNGELVYPLQYVSIYIVSDTKLYLSGGEGARKILVKGPNEGSFRRIELGEFLDLETMEKCDGIEWEFEYYVWDNNSCKGRIDPKTWEIEPVTNERKRQRVCEESELDKWGKEIERRNNLEFKRREEEFEKRREKMRVRELREKVIAGIIFAIILYFLLSIIFS